MCYHTSRDQSILSKLGRVIAFVLSFHVQYFITGPNCGIILSDIPPSPQISHFLYYKLLKKNLSVGYTVICRLTLCHFVLSNKIPNKIKSEKIRCFYFSFPISLRPIHTDNFNRTISISLMA